MAKSTQYTEQFWQDVNEVASILKHKTDFSAYWSLEDNYSFMAECKEIVSETINVPLCNKNKVKKVVKLEHKIVSYLTEWHKLNRDGYNPDGLEFKDWLYNYKIIIYRGIPGKGQLSPIMSVAKNEFKSATLNIEVATRFTQPGWGARGWLNMSIRNGWILVGEITPINIHVFCDDADELECVIKGEHSFDRYMRVENGVVRN